MLKKLTTVLLILYCFISIENKIFAQDEFTTTLTSEYTIDVTGGTLVKQKFQLKNNKSNIYAKQYAVEVSSGEVKNIHVYDANGTLETNITHTTNKTSIGITFPDKLVGKNKTRTFTVEYQNPDVAILTGQVLEASIPKLAEPESFQQYSVILKVPSRFGKPSITYPANYTLGQTPEHTVLTYTEQGERGISAIFGEQQTFSLDLTYHLQNPTSNNGLIQIALPPDTQHQKILFTDIQPRPEEITADQDGNWIATFLLESEQTQTVNVQGFATTHLQPVYDIPITQPNKQLIQPQNYWKLETQTDNIDISTPKKIYDFVTDTLEYNYQRIETLDTEKTSRLGAQKALEQPLNALCTEYTDLFIALARKNNIPSRRLTGFAYTQNNTLRPLSLVKDVLHAWPEYYDETTKRWKPVDPTWGDTTGGVDFFSHLDFNHIVFAINGHTSDKPYPAGVYKLPEQDTKDVHVEFVQSIPNIGFDSTVELQTPLGSLFGFGKPYTLRITNNTGQAWYNVPIHIQANQDIHTSFSTKTLERLLPYETKDIPITITSKDFLRPHKATIHITVQNMESQHVITAPPKITQLKQEIIIGIIGGIITGIMVLLLTRFLLNLRIVKKYIPDLKK